MRALIYVVCLIGAMCGWSCSDHIADSSDLSVQTRTIVSPEGVSTSNPDLISDWEHQSLLTLLLVNGLILHGRPVHLTLCQKKLYRISKKKMDGLCFFILLRH